MKRKAVIATLIVAGSSLLLVILAYRVSPTEPEPGIPRYDIIREVKRADGKVLTGYFVRGGLKLSNHGSYFSVNLFKAHEILERLRHCSTT